MVDIRSYLLTDSVSGYVLDHDAFDVCDAVEMPFLPWKMSDSEKRSVQVLRLLGKSRVPLNKHLILKKLPKEAGSKPTILKIVNDLKRRRYITMKDDPRARGFTGRSEYYVLSWLGLAKVISTLKDDKDDYRFLRNLATEHRNLMSPVFNLWPEIVQAGIEKAMVQNLARFCWEVILYIEEFFREDPGPLAQFLAKPWSPPTEEQEYEWFSRFVRQVGVFKLFVGKPVFRPLSGAEESLLSVDVGFDKSSFDPRNGKAWPHFEAVRRNKMLREAMLGSLRELARMYRVRADVFQENARLAHYLAASLSMPENVDTATHAEIEQWLRNLPEEQRAAFTKLLDDAWRDAQRPQGAP
jgi:hypothetical protein